MQVDDDHVALTTSHQHYSYDQVEPQQGEQPKRRRRRKSKVEGSSENSLKKRKLSDEQVNMLEMWFGCEQKLESERKDRLAAELGLDPRQVAVWFQNRRARWKTKRLEDEYSKLRKKHENLVVEKCHLETEVLSLKDQLNDTKKEMQKFQEGATLSPSSSPDKKYSSNSPSSSMTVEYRANNVMDHQIFINDQFAMGGCLDGMFYEPNSDYVSSFDWMNSLYGM